MKREIITGRIQKFNGHQIIIALKQSESGEPLLDIREHFEKDGVWTPMKAGITVGMSRARLIADAVQMAVQIAEGRHASAK